LLLPLWGCAQPAEAPANAPANTTVNANASTATTPATPAASANANETAIIDHEKQIWDAIKNKDYDAFGNLLAEEFVFVDSHGTDNRAGTLKGVKDFNPTDVTLSDWKVVPIDDDAAVVTYTLRAKGTSMGQPIPDTPVRGSSVWVKRGGKWLGIFHQDTDVDESPAPPATASAAGQPANANANSNANSTEPGGGNLAQEAAEPIAKEKQIWEELKHKNWDAFASDLAANAIEVEPDKVYDKAGSVESAKSFDFSGTTLGDFKQVKIDDDATLVTYVSKDPRRKETWHHSTVWTKQGDKWLAVFHQGSLARPATAAQPQAKPSAAPR
ncbi:MAG TPA: nuclear transport factor 2 family protein, partial [Pyrinomonadaceae bacterium]|nr:nuclear transport factor 2 family protein [Pyrinomonadaceae bacterium]